MRIILVLSFTLLVIFTTFQILLKISDKPTLEPKTLFNSNTPPVEDSFKIGLPIKLEDSEDRAMGLLPFGIHIADHGIDGHPGWDLEYKLDAPILAAADGQVSHINKSSDYNDYNLRIDHRFGNENFATDYVHVGTLAPEITKGAKIKKGQVIGKPAIQTRRLGKNEITYSIIHFQLNDFSKNEGLTNPNAVNPGDYLDQEGEKNFNAIWKNADYSVEIFEPFSNNPRDIKFPQITRWQLKSGDVQYLEFRRNDAKNPVWEYTFLGSDGTTKEQGSIMVNTEPQVGLLVEFTPQNGTKKTGQIEIFDDTMNLELDGLEKVYTFVKN
jgi:hypothetical protein